MTTPDSKRLLVMAGGTGGHIFPGAAVAKHLQSEGWQIHWLGTPARMEAQLVPKLGYKISFIDIAGVRGNGLLRLLAAPFKIIRAIAQARKIMRQFRPDVVLGMGGFASGPGGIAAWFAGIPLVIHEQNAIVGMTNNILRHFAKAMLLGFPNSLTATQTQPKHAVWVGNPVRPEIADIGAALKNDAKEHQVTQHKKAINILIVGGSLGAKCLNENVPIALAALLNNDNEYPMCVQHQCGKGHDESVNTDYQTHVGERLPWRVSEFIDDMVTAYAWADLIICRAGALTVAEVAAAGRSAIFVPLPHAVDDHQTWNARSLVDEQAAWLLPQSELEQGKLAEKLEQILASPHALSDTAYKARQLAKIDATKQVADICRNLAMGRADDDLTHITKGQKSNVVKTSKKERA